MIIKNYFPNIVINMVNCDRCGYVLKEEDDHIICNNGNKIIISLGHCNNCHIITILKVKHDHKIRGVSKCMK